MTGENRNELFWKEWQDILLVEFESRMAAVGVKGQGIVPASKTLAHLLHEVPSLRGLRPTGISACEHQGARKLYYFL